MKEIKINVDNYNENSIKTIEGDNLSEVYKIYICKNKRRIDLTNKIAIMAYVDEYGSKRSNILNLNITNAAEGEIELPITNIISEHNGVYACQVAIYGENNSLEQTAPFSLIVENNIFSKISNTAINSSDFHILSEAIKTTNAYGEKLKQGTENIELQYAKKLNKKLDKDGIVTMVNMGQDVKEAMTHGSVAVVGKDAVDSINIRNGAVIVDKTLKTILPAHIYVEEGAINFEFKDSERKLIITLPRWSYVCIGDKYYDMGSMDDKRVVEVDYPVDYNGVTNLFFDLDAKEISILNFKEYSENSVGSNSNLVFLGLITIKSKFVSIDGNFTIDNKTPNLVSGSVDSDVAIKQIQPAILFGSGEPVKFIFNHNDRKLNIMIPPFSFVSIGSNYYSVYDPGNVARRIEVDYPTVNDGVNFLTFRASTKEFKIYHYSQVDAINRDKDIIVLGTVNFSDGGHVYMIGDYEVNGSNEDDFTISFTKPIQYNELTRVLKIPSFYAHYKYSGGRYIEPSLFELEGEYFTFTINEGLINDTLYLDFSKFINIKDKPKLTSEDLPLVFLTEAKRLMKDSKDKIITTSIYGKLTSKYPIDYVNRDYRTGIVVGRKKPDFKYKENKVVFGSSWVIEGTHFYGLSKQEYDVNLNKDGIMYILFDTISKQLEFIHYTEIDNNLDISNRLLIGSCMCGANKTVQIVGGALIDGKECNSINITSNFDENTNRMILPDKLFMPSSGELGLYASSFLREYKLGEEKLNAVYTQDDIDVKINTFVDDFRLTKDLPPTLRIGMRQYKDNNLYYKDLQLVKPKTGKALKIMHIGDSITNRNVGYYNKLFLEKWGFTPTFIGTFTNSNGVLGEGREGWTYSNFIGRENTYMNNGRPIVANPTPGLNNDLNKNPFLKIADEEDKRNYPKWCFRANGQNGKQLSYEEDINKEGDFYIFDFSNYLKIHTLENPDIVTIALSTNDINTLDWWEDSCSFGLEVMYKQIRKALPNAKIGIVPAPTWGIGNLKWNSCASVWIEKCMKQVKDYNDDNLFIIPIWCHIQKEWTHPLNIPTEIESCNKSTIRDTIHFADEGEKQYGKAMASFCSCVI